MKDDQSSATTNPSVLPVLHPDDPPVSAERDPAAIYLVSVGVDSHHTIRTTLKTIAKILGVGKLIDADRYDMRFLAVLWGNLRYQHTIRIQATLVERYPPTPANKLLAALQCLLKDARRLRQLSADNYERVIDIPNIQATPLPRGRLLNDSEVAVLLWIWADNPTPGGARDAAIIALLHGTGPRRGEAVALNLADYRPTTESVIIQTDLGQKARAIYVPSDRRVALDEWIAVRGSAWGSLFVGLVKGGTLVVRRLAAQAGAIVCAARVGEASVAAFTPHDIRRTFISHLLDAGAYIATVQHLAGHADIAAASRNDHRSEAVKQRTIDLNPCPLLRKTRDAVMYGCVCPA